MQIIIYGCEIPKFLWRSSLKRIDPKHFDSSKYSSNSLKGFVLEAGLEYSKELFELYNDYLLAVDKI